ncbi:MAG: class I SAM-dependent methyltransferase [Cyanobacteria bacterium REEB67]|nr:class I SAM-dependent methyltransferase [Cyanobacteria bacterium REEB67]
MSSIKPYNERADKYVESYESLSFEHVHSQMRDLMPPAGSAVLDVGAGSGRDAAWFARSGCQVLAVEPAAAMLARARELHKEPEIRWQQDTLPGLEKTMGLGLSFDLVWLSAVWMHVAPGDRQRAFRKMLSLLRAGGMIVFTLRHGDFDDGREAYPVSVDEIEKLSRQYGLAVHRVFKSEDALDREGVLWETVCLKLPEDGTEALPLLRHIILNESKSSTYKLALLRILVRIADSASGMAKITPDDQVSIPLGLVALYWLRTYKLLVEQDIPQMPPNASGKGLSFAREPFRQLHKLSVYDLRIGATFTGTDAEWLAMVLVDAKNTIHKNPAYYIRYPNSDKQIFETIPGGRLIKATAFTLDEQFLVSFGEMRIPREIWNAMSRFASWIEPSLLGEWVRLMQSYLKAQERDASYDRLMQALVWLDPERDTTLVRAVTNGLLLADRPLRCIWSGQRLSANNFDVDHCFPFAAWPCGDLWNLMPTNRVVNQKHKRDKLVTAAMLETARQRLEEWWQIGYVENDDFGLGHRFVSEANAALPLGMSGGGMTANAQIFEGIALKRAALKRNLQLPDWEM